MTAIQSKSESQSKNVHSGYPTFLNGREVTQFQSRPHIPASSICHCPRPGYTAAFAHVGKTIKRFDATLDDAASPQLTGGIRYGQIISDSPMIGSGNRIPQNPHLVSFPSARLRIGKIPWHTGHDYELTKMPVDFLIAGDTHRVWATAQRPVPPNVRFVSSDALEGADLLILHVDQWTLQEIDKLTLFRRGLRMNVPKVIINHGCNMVDGCSSKEMRELLGDEPTICNSSTAHALWGIKNSIYIHHGMSPEEWPQTNYGRQNIVVTQPASQLHSAYRNNDAIYEFEARTGIRIDWIGRDHAFSEFARYRSFLAKSSIYFNPSFASPNPRARTEAMLCGLAPVTTNSHGESNYIENGVNGYCSNDLQELFEVLVELRRDPVKCMRMGLAARRTAQERFHISVFLARWREVLHHVLGRSFDLDGAAQPLVPEYPAQLAAPLGRR